MHPDMSDTPAARAAIATPCEAERLQLHACGSPWLGWIGSASARCIPANVQETPQTCAAVCSGV
eukprot:3229781-Alexandrium_andersonii.AAC.1